MEETTNYELPLYEGEDSPDLLECYNVSIRDIDTILKTISDSIIRMTEDIESLNQRLRSLADYVLLEGDLFQPNKFSPDLPVTVSDMEYLCQDIHGIVYNSLRIIPPPPPPSPPNE